MFYEIDQNDLTELGRIGNGFFGIVQKGKWRSHKNVSIYCAIKSLFQMSEELEAEILTMTQLRHPNIVSLYGAVLKGNRAMVMELCEGGSLKDRLICKKKSKLLAISLLEYSKQIACGMKYLAAKNFVHRDLAARNVLLTADEKMIKIGDFGLARNVSDNTDYYFKQSAAPLPTLWTAPEAIRWKKFSEFSDVWSFGVTMWEIFSHGQNPWADCENYKVPTLIFKGERLKKRDSCPQDLYDIMYRCWNIEARARPTFELIEKILSKYFFQIAICKPVPKIEKTLSLNFCVKDDEEIMTKILKENCCSFRDREMIIIEKRNVVNHTTKKDWRRNCFVFSLASLMVIGIIKLIYMWLVPSCNLYEGIFIDEGSSISELIKLPADTSSCDRGTVWYYNSTNISNEFSFFVHSQPKHCKDFCMCDSTKTCYRPKNNSNYMVGFKHHCEKSCQFSSMIMDKPFESFLDENGNEINTPDEHYVKVDSFGCHGCDSLRKCPTCNKQRTLDNVQITANGTTVEITWNVTSKFSIVELEVYNASTTRIWREKNAQSPIFVPSHLIDPDEKYILSVYFYQDRRINNVKKRMWTIAFNLNLYNHEN